MSERLLHNLTAWLLLLVFGFVILRLLDFALLSLVTDPATQAALHITCFWAGIAWVVWVTVRLVFYTVRGG